METLGDVNQTGQLTVWDRDHAGMLRSGHNNSIYYGVNFGTAVWPSLKGQSSNPASPVYFSGSGNAPSCVTSCGIVQILPYNRLEGFDWSGVTIQGARVVDSSTGQWTTPDAYAGDVHDPMSQKPFMWDRNNPLEYSDPSGYNVITDAWVKLEDLLSARFRPAVEVRVSPALQKDLQARITATNNAVERNLKPSDVAAAINEAKGGVTTGKFGDQFNHITEVRNALGSFDKTLKAINELQVKYRGSPNDMAALKALKSVYESAKRSLLDELGRAGVSNVFTK
jgi:hypothetical protein